MNYRIEVYDTWNRRIASHDEVPLLKVVRTMPDKRDTIKGILPGNVTDLGPGYRIRVLLEDKVFLNAYVTRVKPQWSDTRKLILERFVHFHEVIEFEAEREARDGNTTLSRAYTNRTISQIAKDAINRATGKVHYLVDHTSYPNGAQREYTKFDARKMTENELEVGGILVGQWVGGARIDYSGASAKDGDTIQGLVVDGITWPDFRLMLIDSEETSRNSHAQSLHPEVAFWTNDQYDNSNYKFKADAATDFLQNLIDTEGIDFIELNPHRDATGAFDDRVDIFGRYLGLIYGGGECYNAGLIEQDHAEVLLFADGKFHVPELELKDFFSYRGPNSDSIQDSSVIFESYDVTGGVFEVLTAIAYAADGFIWDIDDDLALSLRRSDTPDRVIFFNPVEHGILLGSNSDSIANLIFFEGNPTTTAMAKTYADSPSLDEYGVHARGFDYFSISQLADADALVNGIMADTAYPEPSGEITFLHGDSDVRVGDILEVRDGPLRRLERELANEWSGRFVGKLVGRVKEVEHVFQGQRVVTQALFTSPFRSVENPISFIVRSQPDASTLFQFRLDEATVGLDLGYHLD